MDLDSSSKFIASLAKFLQSLCNGYVEFDKGVEVIGHIYLSVDSDTGKKIDYVLNEKVCKNDNSVTFISNSFHAQPAEKPKPPPKKSDLDKRNEDSVVMDESGQTVPSSTNVGTVGPIRIRISHDDSYSLGGKRPRSPHRKGSFGKGVNSPSAKHGTSPRFDAGGPAKMGRSDVPYSSANSMNSNEDYDGGGFQEEDDGYPSNFLSEHNSAQDIDQKPIIDPDISIVKEEYMASQQANTQVPSSQSHMSGPGRGKSSVQSAYPMMMHQNPSTPLGSHSTDAYSGTSLEGADPAKIKPVKTKKSAANSAKYRQRLNQNPDLMVFHRQRESARKRKQYHDMSVEQRLKHTERCKQNQKAYRDRKKHESITETTGEMRKPSTCQERQHLEKSKRAEYMREWRKNMSSQKRQAINKTRMDRYYADRAVSNSHAIPPTPASLLPPSASPSSSLCVPSP